MGLHLINRELTTAENRLAVLDRLLADVTDESSLDYLRARRSDWLRYKASLLIVRDQRPDAAVRGTVEV